MPYFFMHMEIGYKQDTALPVAERTVLPKPEYSGPNNTAALERVYRQIAPGVVETAVMEIVQILNDEGKVGLFLSMPYFAEKYGGVLITAANYGHIVGIHMHENWKALTSKMSLETLTDYLRSEKARLEKAVGRAVTIFSYGPGVELDESLPFPTKFSDVGWLTGGEITKFFQAVANAGYRVAISALEYQKYAPPTLVIWDNFRRTEPLLIGLPHSYELHSKSASVWREEKETYEAVSQLWTYAKVRYIRRRGE